ncbi:MAG: flagellar biosynthesis anti-sigma factor FlgM [Nitrospiraceae bacterium]|nr:MAG: flagellar biosynthesis anti-sigma factor FlgM [Nitrospiraceae bacterium]
MKINGNNPVEGKDLYNKVRETNTYSEAERSDSARNSDADKDRISLSGNARKIHELKGLIEQLPDIRTDRVEELRKALDAGQYNVDPLKIAEKVLEEI